MDMRLVELKTRFGDSLPWEQQFALVTPDDQVLQLAWGDAQTVLFMATVNSSDTGPEASKEASFNS